jgi:hypothetical protein
MTFAGRELMCACGHGPAVHTDGGTCLLAARGSRCRCRRWSPVPWVEDEHECERTRQLEAELLELKAFVAEHLTAKPPAVDIPQQRGIDVRRPATRPGRA